MLLNKTRLLLRPVLSTIPCRGVKAKAPRVKLGPFKYVPPPDQFPCLVRQESILKSLVLENPEYPISLNRLDEIRDTPGGWLPRKVPPPELPFECKRAARRFEITTNTKKWKGKVVVYTSVHNVKGDLEAFRDCLKWRLGEDTPMKIFNDKTVVVVGYHVKEISMLLLGLGF